MFMCMYNKYILLRTNTQRIITMLRWLRGGGGGGGCRSSDIMQMPAARTGANSDSTVEY